MCTVSFSLYLHVIYSSDLVFIPLIFAGYLVCFSCVCAGGSGSRSAPRRKAKKRARRLKRTDDTEEDREVVIPTKPTRREKSAAAKQRVAIPMHKWKQQDWERFRLQNPYEIPIHLHWTTPQFRNETQMRIVHELFEHN